MFVGQIPTLHTVLPNYFLFRCTVDILSTTATHTHTHTHGVHFKVK